jgi:hypothetical protein
MDFRQKKVADIILKQLESRKEQLAKDVITVTTIDFKVSSSVNVNRVNFMRH